MIAARVWKFGDNVSTDLMLPGPALILSPEEQTSWVFQANRPGWVDEVRPGDFIVGGRGFGLGSSRPGARSLRNLGVGCVLAESIARLFFRNCVNFGLLAVECAGISAAFEEGQTAELSTKNWTVRNRQTSQVLACTPVPAMLLGLMQGGGIYPMLERNGLVAPPQVKPSA